MPVQRLVISDMTRHKTNSTRRRDADEDNSHRLRFYDIERLNFCQKIKQNNKNIKLRLHLTISTRKYIRQQLMHDDKRIKR